MAQSTFKAIRTVTVDRITTSYNGQNLFRDGALILGSSKTSDRNVIQTFDLLAPDDGLALSAASQISLAELFGNVTAVIGGPYNMLAERLTRADYDYLTATWTEYKSGSAWTTPGGDFSATPAGTDVPFPTFTGDGVICATLASFVVDALANRGGKLYLHWRIDPVGPSQSQQVTVKSAPPADSDVMRLRVTYTTLQPAAENRPHGTTLHGAPAAHPSRAAGSASAERPAKP
jgi:hypothetical protein